VDLPEIGQAGPAACQIAVPDERAGVGVALDAVAFHQNDALLDWFAEVVPRVGLGPNPSNFSKNNYLLGPLF
jgi:hypothetical protein